MVDDRGLETQGRCSREFTSVCKISGPCWSAINGRIHARPRPVARVTAFTFHTDTPLIPGPPRQVARNQWSVRMPQTESSYLRSTKKVLQHSALLLHLCLHRYRPSLLPAILLHRRRRHFLPLRLSRRRRPFPSVNDVAARATGTGVTNFKFKSGRSRRPSLTHRRRRRTPPRFPRQSRLVFLRR